MSPTRPARRGFTTRQLMRLNLGETLLVGLVGGVVGLVAAGGVGSVAFGSASLGATGWAAVTMGSLALVLGVAVAGAAVLLPAYRDARHHITSEVGDAQQPTPLALRLGLDVLALAGSALAFYLSGRNGYQIVLVPEGLVTISVSYWAMAGPALLWLGGGCCCGGWSTCSFATDEGYSPRCFARSRVSSPDWWPRPAHVSVDH